MADLKKPTISCGTVAKLFSRLDMSLAKQPRWSNHGKGSTGARRIDDRGTEICFVPEDYGESQRETEKRRERFSLN